MYSLHVCVAIFLCRIACSMKIASMVGVVVYGCQCGFAQTTFQSDFLLPVLSLPWCRPSEDSYRP